MSSSYICSDLVYEILSRVSLATLGVCRAVSKEWNHISYSQALISLRSQRTDSLHGYMVRWFDYANRRLTASFDSPFLRRGDRNDLFDHFRNDRDRPLSLDFLRWFGCPLAMVAAHQGIVLCLRDNPKYSPIPQYIVCKPSTKQWVVIPNPRTRNLTVVIDLIVLRSQPVLHYKIVRVSTPRNYTNYTPSSRFCRIEVFDSETWKWKKLDDTMLPHRMYVLHPYNRQKVVVSGTTCVLLDYPDSIFMFDMMEETWVIHSLPFKKVDGQTGIVKVEGKLGVLYRNSAEGELWLMKDHRNNVWCKTKYEVTVEFSLEVMRDFRDWMLPPGVINPFYRPYCTRPEAMFPFDTDFEPTNLERPKLK
ncbi:hypothetical protein MLD38_003455 [Melastoma candidum]|uniref:Uncharacterized protein n=1 Tax=Melastoma candidum TaxID=119954 RepID=A0ACB9S772_9MYRT|nr:hypothetical protein MLD38_003455 [Melastoma candidum]